MPNGKKLQKKIKKSATRLKAGNTGLSEYLTERVTASYLTGAVIGAGVTGAPSKKDIISKDKSHTFNPVKSKYPKQP